VRRHAAFGLALLAAGGATAVRAQARDAGRIAVALTYESDGPRDTCPPEIDLRQGVVNQLGYNPFSAVAAAHHIVARIHATSGSVEGYLVWTDASGTLEGERRLAASNGDCSALGRAMIFALVVQIELIGQLASKVEIPSPPPPASTATARPQPPRYALGLGPVFLIGATPEATPGARVFAAGRHGAASLEVGAQASFVGSLRRADGTGFDARVVAGTLALCGHWRRLALCSLGTAGALLVTGFGVDEPHSPSAFTAGAGLRAALQQPLSSRFVLNAHADALATLTPRTISLNELPVWTTPAVTFSVGVDLAMQLR
jgi:hypothetical protein